MTLLFLDTEWADSVGSDLVSLALISEDGNQRFYAEVAPLPKNPTDFVRHVVYPLLDHGYASRQKIELTRDLRTFLAGIDSPQVLYDSDADGELFGLALDGFHLSEQALAHLPPAPAVTTKRIEAWDLVRNLIAAYFLEHPEQENRKHHAMVDAEALRWAYGVALGKEDAPYPACS